MTIERQAVVDSPRSIAQALDVKENSLAKALRHAKQRGEIIVLHGNLVLPANDPRPALRALPSQYKDNDETADADDLMNLPF
jgi:hypothetical protein